MKINLAIMKKNLFFLLGLFFCIKLSSQVVIKSHTTPTMTSKGIFGRTTKISETIIPALTDKEIANSVKKDNNKFAEPKLTDISFFVSASNEVFEDTIIYRHKVAGVNATSITIIFDKLLLSEKAELYVYNPEGTIITGPITASENIGKGRTWSTNSFPGNSVIIELRLPKKEQFQNELHISKILLGLPLKIKLKNLSDSLNFGKFNASSSCNINVLCAQGNAWSNERKAVCLIETENGGSGSGSLVMNTCSTNKPFLLTAWHIVNGLNPNNWTFIFGWWSSTCTPNTNNQQALLFNGASVRATYNQTDCALLELFQTPPPTSNITYLGWSRSSSIPSTSVGIHHPQGDQMKISFANSPATIGTIYTYPNTAWRVLWNLGTVELGSLGSPLFDANHRVIGQLYSGTQPVGPPCNQLTGGNNYGRFDLSWTGGGTNSTRLSNWLDASNSGATTTTTTNVSNLINASPALSISGNSALCFGTSSYILSGVTMGTISWSSSNTSVATISGQGNTATLTKVGNGSIFITATVAFCPGNTASVTKQIDVGVANNYYIQSIYVDPYPPAITVYISSSGSSRVVTSWDIAVDGNYSQSGSGYPPSVTYVNGGTSCGSHTVTLTVYNGCGGYSSSSSFYRYGCYGYTLTPNPATNQVTITDTTVNNKLLNTTAKVTITVFDQANRSLKQFIFPKNYQYNFSVGDLVPGTYIIQIKQNNSINNLKLIKQ